MNKTKVKCPPCYSDQLCKFDLDKQANQKYQYKKCECQFAPKSVSKPKYQNILSALTLVKLHIYIININTTIIISVLIENVIR